MKVFLNVFEPVSMRLEKNKSEPKKDGEIGSFRAYIQLKISKDVGV